MKNTKVLQTKRNIHCCKSVPLKDIHANANILNNKLWFEYISFSDITRRDTMKYVVYLLSK